MKKRRMLFLIPMIGLFLTGCDAKSVLRSAKSWISNNIYHPAIDFIDNALDGGTVHKGEEPGEEEQKEEEQSGDKEDEGGEDGGEGDTPEPEVIYDLVLDKKEQLEVKDEGYLYQANLDGLKVDFIGYESSEETLGSIKKITYATQSFDGMIFATFDTHSEDYLNTAEGKKLPVKHCIKDTEGWQLNHAVKGALEERGFTPVIKYTYGSVDLPEFGWPSSAITVSFFSVILLPPHQSSYILRG